jgi:hypothetical protein
MTTATVTGIELSGSRWRPAPPLLSLLLHLLVAAALLVPWRLDLADALPPAIEVEVVPEPAPPPPHPQPQPEAKPQPQPQAKPEPPAKAEPPKPIAPPARPLPPPVVRAPVPVAAPRPDTVVAVSLDKAERRSARDVILGQVLPRMKLPPQFRGRDGVLTVDVEVRPGGLLAPPFSRDLPWNPAAAIEGLDALAPADPRRVMVEGFYRALREAQPLALPPDLVARLPFKLPLDFRIADVP